MVTGLTGQNMEVLNQTILWAGGLQFTLHVCLVGHVLTLDHHHPVGLEPIRYKLYDKSWPVDISGRFPDYSVFYIQYVGFH